MYSINFNVYNRIANELIEALSTTDYYSGVIEFEEDGKTFRFVSSLIVYHDRVNSETDAMSNYLDAMSNITNVIPIWHEMTTSKNGDEITNDFDFKILKNIIRKCSY